MTLKNKCLFCDNKKTKLLEEDNHMNIHLCDHHLKEYLDLIMDNKRKTQLMRRMVVSNNLLD